MGTMATMATAATTTEPRRQILDSRWAWVRERLDPLRQRLDPLRRRMDPLRQRLDPLRQRMDPLRQRMGTLRWQPASLRTPILAWFIGVLALATISSVVVTYRVLLVRLDQRIDAELAQEAAELGRLTGGNDPRTGKPFGPQVRRIFEVYLQRNVPSRNEALITFVGRKPFLRSRPVVPYRLDRDRELVARWTAIRTADRGHVDTPAGRVEYVAIPLRRESQTLGVFVAAIFVEGAKAEADAAVRAAGAVGLGLLLLGSLLAWRIADRVARPVTALTKTARSISGTDLSGRIPVHGRDQVAQLASTFNDMLDRLEHAFGSQRRFVDDASHELKTPLTIVRGHLELLDDSNPEEREATLALVVDELDRMGRIVQDLLLLAKHGRPDFLNVEMVEVGALSDELYAKAKALAPGESALEERGTGVIVADRQRLTQAAVQLAENAVRHGAEGGAIALGSRVADGEARFWVRNDGPGIPVQDQQEIFERFRRGSNGRRSDGAGLGLAIVKAIAEAHSGRVELESRAGAGATFTLVLPVGRTGNQRTRAK
jgi:two-component system, OmpR family, sensor kinase